MLFIESLLILRGKTETSVFRSTEFHYLKTARRRNRFVITTQCDAGMPSLSRSGNWSSPNSMLLTEKKHHDWIPGAVHFVFLMGPCAIWYLNKWKPLALGLFSNTSTISVVLVLCSSVIKDKQVKILDSCELPANKTKKYSGLNKMQLLLSIWDFLSV